MNFENMKLTQNDIERIQSIIIEKIVRDDDENQTKELNKLLDKLAFCQEDEFEKMCEDLKKRNRTFKEEMQ